ncbi:MAG: hypothetical protein WC457_04970 [Patescibacteria group bacterium]
MTDNILQEFRCEHCNKLFFKGDVQHATIEIKCRNCKQISKIEASGRKLWLLADEKGDYKNSEGKSKDECPMCGKKI